jgi:hypothetical protein
MTAKQRRLGKNSKNHGTNKVQILEEPLSDEVSPGVTLTTSAKISPTSDPNKSQETTPVMEKSTLAEQVKDTGALS